ncbi:hypothetical protein, partial [Mucilaginibacter galii]
SGWSIWPGMPGQFAPEWGGQFDAESMVTFRRNQVVNISGISKKGPIMRRATRRYGVRASRIKFIHLRKRLWYAFVYTCSTFFRLTLKMEKIKFSNWKGCVYLITVYVFGLITLAYLANYILNK